MLQFCTMLMSAKIKLACQCFMLRGNNRAHSIFLGIKKKKLYNAPSNIGKLNSIYVYTGGAELNLSSEISQKLYICSRTLGPTIVSEKRHNTNPALLHLYIYTSIIYFYMFLSCHYPSQLPILLNWKLSSHLVILKS